MDAVRRGTSAAGALAAALLITALPAYGASGAPAGVGAGTPTSLATETPAATVSPTPSASPTSTPSPTVSPPPDDRLLPDLVALQARKPRVQVRRDGRFLRFESSLGNVGVGPLEVRPHRSYPCPRGQQSSTQIIYRDANGNGRYARRTDTRVRRYRAGCMVYHPYHRHWHFGASARYALLDPSKDGRVVVSTRRKVSFCLRDSARVPARFGRFAYSARYGSCTRTAPQGISVGWMDVYQAWLPGQSLRLPKNLKNGLYCLETTVDPLDQLIESNNRNNKSVRAVAVRGNRVTVREASRCR